MSLESQLLTAEDRKRLAHTVLVRERLEEQYANLEQQNETAALGMWLFLATEVMFFGTLFVAFGIYRYLYAPAFELASGRLNWQIGSMNTAVLLFSSLTMALAVYNIRTDRVRWTAGCLLITAALGACFLALKGYEYYEDLQQGLVPTSRFDRAAWLSAGVPQSAAAHVRLFLLLYWVMTLAHALHMIVGIAAVLLVAVLTARGHFDSRYYGPVEVVGLYWHFIDLIWIFLLPMLYLAGTHR
jgi:cytochrome c oxidase subunit 3